MLSTSQKGLNQNGILTIGGRARVMILLLFAGICIATAIESTVRYIVPAVYHFDHVPGIMEKSRNATGHGVQEQLMDDEAFWNAQVLVGTLTMSVFGLGLEVVIGYEILRAMEINSFVEHSWVVAQFLFGILAMTSFLCMREGGAISIFLGPLALWKFGFPETIMNMIKFTRNTRRLPLRLAALFDSFGCLTHHTCSCLTLSLHVWGRSPATRAVFAMSTPLLLQHVVIPLKYSAPGAYLLSEFILEVLWEWETISSMGIMFEPHGLPISDTVHSAYYNPILLRCMMGMLFGHWFYWTGGILEHVFEHGDSSADK